jgi:oligosaccharide repeat unit polymerase
MIFVVILAILILTIICRRIGRSWFFPPVIYSLYWAFIMLGTILPVLSKGKLTADSMLVFLLGAYCYAAGGIMALAVIRPSSTVSRKISESRIRSIQTIIIGFSTILLVMVPLFVKSIQQLANSLRIESFAIGSRFILGLPDQGGISRIFRSSTSLAVVLAYYAAWQYRGFRRDKITLVMAVVAPLIMNILTFGRTPIFMLIIGVLAILLFRKRIDKARALAIFLFTLYISFNIGVALKKGPEGGLGESPFLASINNLTVHHLGGPVAFGQVMESPELVGERGLSLRFFTQTLNSFGLKNTVPNNVLDYIGGDLGNVYTWYFAYWLDAGWLGIIVFSVIGGFVSGIVYLFARRASFLAGAAWGLVISAILDSAVIDLLFGSAVPWLLIGFVGVLLYYFRPLQFSRKKRSRTSSKVNPGRF